MFSKLKSKKKEDKSQGEKPDSEPPRTRQYDFKISMLLLGESDVGKAEIRAQFVNDPFSEFGLVSKIGIDFKILTLEINGKRVKLQIWDTQGQERFRTITRSYYRGHNGLMIVFDVTNEKSFVTAKRWLTDIHEDADVCKILVGNNCHKMEKRVVDNSVAKEFALQYGIAYFDVSAKENINIDEAFFSLIWSIFAKIEGHTVEPHLSSKKIDIKKLDQRVPRRPDYKPASTHQHQDNTPSDIQLPHSQIQETSDKSTSPEVHPKVPEKETAIQKEMEQHRIRAQEAEERLQFFKTELVQYQKQIEDRNKEIQLGCKQNRDLEEKIQILEESIQAARKQIQEKELLVASNHETIQDLQSRLKQSDEAIQEARQQVRDKEQQALRQTENIRTLENRIKELEEEGTETQQHITELEEQLRHAEIRLKNSDQIFQDIFQRLLGQLPQSQPHWVIQRNEIQLTGEELGTGGWASVKVALFRGQRVAAKCLHHQIISAHNIRLFTREMTMAARARHPNLLQFIGATMDNNPIILTELMPTSLRRILEEGVHLSRIQIVSIASDVARALNYLHLNTPDPIIHRDISSANVLLEQFGENYKAKVSDYGSANFSRYTSTAGPGNPLYSAPESGDPSRQSIKMDVYSFGLLLIEMCSGELFDDHEELIRTHINDWPEIVSIIRPCLRRDPKRRLNMDSVVTQLNQIQGTLN